MEETLRLRQAFEAEEHELRLRQSKVACILGIVLIPAGTTLDYISYPDQLLSLVAIPCTSGIGQHSTCAISQWPDY
jgi:hypothetical protein